MAKIISLDSYRKQKEQKARNVQDVQKKRHILWRSPRARGRAARDLALIDPGSVRAICPEYVDGRGDCTRLYLMGAQELLVELKAAAVLQGFARRSGRSLALARRRAHDLLGSGHDLPLALDPQMVLMPVYVRRARFRGDGTRAYLNLAADLPPDLVEEAGHAEVAIGPCRFPVLWSPLTLRRAVRLASLASEHERTRALLAALPKKQAPYRAI